jgi:hypothetical protein
LAFNHTKQFRSKSYNHIEKVQIDISAIHLTHIAITLYPFNLVAAGVDNVVLETLSILLRILQADAISRRISAANPRIFVSWSIETSSSGRSPPIQNISRIVPLDAHSNEAQVISWPGAVHVVGVNDHAVSAARGVGASG